jgi:hypothetical protein
VESLVMVQNNLIPHLRTFPNWNCLTLWDSGPKIEENLGCFSSAHADP